MKKPSSWAGIIGTLIIISNGYNLAKSLVETTSLFWVNVALVTTNILWIALGVFLVVLFIRLRHREDSNILTEKPAVNSPKDIERLSKQRCWILGFVLAIEMLSSVQVWILNDYTAGLTLINATVIFDVVLNAVFLYVMIEFFRGKRDVLRLFFYTVIVYTIGGVLMSLLRQQWTFAASYVVFGFYFIFAVKAPLSRMNHRIAHLVILPIVLVLSVIITVFDQGNVSAYNQKLEFAQQRFEDATSHIADKYQVFLVRDFPTERDISSVQTAIAEREPIEAEVRSIFQGLRTEFEKRLPNIVQQKNLEKIRYNERFLDLHREQVEKLTEYMDYAKRLDFFTLTQKQIDDIEMFNREIREFESKMSNLRFERASARIGD